MKTTQELQQLSVEELTARRGEAQKELQKLRVKASMGVTPENPLKIKQTRKLIARIYTIINEKNRPEKKQEHQREKPKEKSTGRQREGASHP
ncbi:MAG: 50S ribosomal protein L29 [Nanoarchaeota archaeon]